MGTFVLAFTIGKHLRCRRSELMVSAIMKFPRLEGSAIT
jgi:hypothetical protein